MKKKYFLILSILVMVFGGIFLSGCQKCKKDEPPVVNYYYVTFDENNGNPTTMIRVEEGKTVSKPADPVKAGNDFLYWTYNNNEFDFNTPINNHITLVAAYQVHSTTTKTTRIVWNENEAIEYSFDGSVPRVVEVGTLVKFKIRISPYYEGNPVVLVNNQTIEIDQNGYYTFTTEDLTSNSVEVKGLTKQNEKISGLGTSSDPYKITNESQFKTFTDKVNSLNNTSYNGAYVVLENDLDFNGFTIDVIGTELNSNQFSGSFDGQNHTISNFNLEADNGIYGLFGYLVVGTVMNLKIQNDLVVTPTSDANNLIGGLVAYNIASDVINCEFNGSITVINNLSQAANIYVGSLIGYMQSYRDTGGSTLSYGVSHADIIVEGENLATSVGGLVGLIYGANEEYPAFIYNSYFDGTISGDIFACGGITGTIRTNASLANTYTKGSITTKSNKNQNISAGALCGIAENETAITYSFSTMNIALNNPSLEDYIKGDLIGASYKDGKNAMDDRRALVVDSYYSKDGQVIKNDHSYDLNKPSDVLALLNWNHNDWYDDLNPNYEMGEQTAFSVDFNFGKDVTNYAPDGSLLTQKIDHISITDLYLPIYWVYNNIGMNSFVADDGTISYGFFLDEECTIRVPASYILSQNSTIYVGFADYQDVAGEYYITLNGQEIRLLFTNNGRMEMSYNGIVANYMYIYDGEKLTIKDTYFVYIEYPSLADSPNIDRDCYAIIKDNKLLIYNDDFFPLDGGEIVANKSNHAMGTWYGSDNKVYTFLADGTGTVSDGATFSYECTESSVTIMLGMTTIKATISDDGTLMEGDSGTIFSINKFDEYRGSWEAEFKNPDTIVIDGRGHLTYRGDQYDYTIDEEGILKFSDYEVYFNEEGMLVLSSNNKTKIFGQKGSFIGTWTDTIIDYWIILEGINKDGYGYGYDSFGYNFTYANTGDDEEGDFINFFYGTTMYGYGYLSVGNDGSEMLFLAIYTPSRGMIVDDYNVAYIDPFYGTWHANNGMSLEFNGLGAYDIDFYVPTLDNEWDVRGFVDVTVNNVTTSVRYYFDRHTTRGNFIYNGTTYEITTKDDKLIINGTVFEAPDDLSLYKYQYRTSDGFTIISFNGKSSVNLGEVTFTISGEEKKYRYEIDENIVNIYQQEDIIYTITMGENYELTDVVNNQKYNLGLYHKLINKTFAISNTSELILDNPFDINGNTTATLITSTASETLDVRYLDENYLVLYFEGTFLYYVYYLTEDCAALCNSEFSPVSAIATADELRGTWSATDGNIVTFTGLSKASAYARITCIVSETDLDEQYLTEYYYEYNGSYYVVYDVINDVEVEKYYVYTTPHENSIAYTKGDQTIYVVVVTD